MGELRERIKARTEENKDKLLDYLKLESVSAQKREIDETAAYVKNLLEAFGAEVEILSLADKPLAHPVVYGFIPAKEVNKPTLLIYNHYDVQPEDPVEEWQTRPFEPVEKDGAIFCRGVSDNKANLIARLNAIQLYLEDHDGLPINIKFLIEGEEEIGSVHIDDYLAQYQDKFAANACIWESGSKDGQGRLHMSAGMKGIAYFDLANQTADIDVHSSQAAIVDNAAWRLIQALASMKDAKNRVTIDGFYDLMEEPNQEARAYLDQVPFDPDALKEGLNLRTDFITDDLDYSEKEALYFYPTLTISGLDAGYQGDGAKTILPKSARAKLDVRLVPGYTPENVQKLLRDHLDSHGYADFDLDLIAAVKPFRTDLTDPFIDLMVQTGETIYGKGKAIITPNSPGTGPMQSFGHYLGVPIVGIGSEYRGSGAHAPNEHIRWEDFYDNIAHILGIIENFDQVNWAK